MEELTLKELLETIKDDLVMQENRVRVITQKGTKKPIVLRLFDDDTIEMAIGYQHVCLLDDVFDGLIQYFKKVSEAK